LKHILRVLAVAMLATTVLVVVSLPALARPKLGGVELSQTKVCEMLAKEHPRFEWRPPPPDPPETCWHISEGLEQASTVVPPE
jgi:hypothetical protein